MRLCLNLILFSLGASTSIFAHSLRCDLVTQLESLKDASDQKVLQELSEFLLTIENQGTGSSVRSLLRPEFEQRLKALYKTLNMKKSFSGDIQELEAYVASQARKTQLSNVDSEVHKQQMKTQRRAEECVELWTHRIVELPEALEGALGEVAFSPDSQRLFFYGHLYRLGRRLHQVLVSDQTPKATQVTVKDLLPEATTSPNVSSKLIMSADGRHLALLSNARHSAVVRVDENGFTFRRINFGSFAGEITVGAFGPDGKKLYVGGSSRSVFSVDLDDDKLMAESIDVSSAGYPAMSGIQALAVSGDGQHLVVAGVGGKLIQVSASAPYSVMRVIKPSWLKKGEDVYKTELSLDGTLMLQTNWRAGRDRVVDLSKPGFLVKQVNAENPKIGLTTINHSAFDLNQKFLLLVESKNLLRLVDLGNHELLARPTGANLSPGDDETVSTLKLSPDGKTLAVTTSEGRLVLWNAIYLLESVGLKF